MLQMRYHFSYLVYKLDILLTIGSSTGNNFFFFFHGISKKRIETKGYAAPEYVDTGYQLSHDK